MNNTYKHITVINDIEDQTVKYLRLALYRTTLVYWIGKPSRNEVDQAIIKLGKINIVEDASDIRLAVKVAAMDFRSLEKQLLSNYLQELENMGAVVINTQGKPRKQFLKSYDKRIALKLSKLKRSGN